jgi:hypothetical protein
MDAVEQRTRHESRADRGLWLLIAGALILAIAGLISIPLLRNRAVPLAPADTPEGVVQRFYQAAYGGDYTAAYELVSHDVRERIAIADLQQQLSSELRDSQAHVGRATIHGDTATVEVTLTHYAPGGLFGSNEWTEQRQVLLQREDGAWRISSGAFYLPPQPLR